MSERILSTYLLKYYDGLLSPQNGFILV